jgi:hypothetical protein
MMKQVQIILFVALAMAALPRAGSAQATHMANSPKAELYTSDPLVVGTTTLKPGHYEVQCKTIDGQEFLVVSSATNADEIARVPCVPEVLGEALKATDFRSTKGADGVRALTAVRIKGERVVHHVASL